MNTYVSAGLVYSAPTMAPPVFPELHKSLEDSILSAQLPITGLSVFLTAQVNVAILIKALSSTFTPPIIMQ